LTEDILFENPEIAKYVLEVLFRLNDQMLETIKAVEKETSSEECRNFNRAIGHVVIEVFEKIIEPICHRHPSLKPPEMET
jgi:hypothetical protein